MKENLSKQHKDAPGLLLGVGFAGGLFALGVTWLFYAITVEYVRLVAQVIALPKF